MMPSTAASAKVAGQIVAGLEAVMQALRVSLLAIGLGLAAMYYAHTAMADGAPPAPGEAWRASPYHGVTDGDGKTIPCLCRFRGQDFRLGTAVCMNTHVGTVIARCDLFLNNTTWVPTDQPCVMSFVPRQSGFASLR